MPNSAMHPFCCVSSMAISSSNMPAVPQSPSDPLASIQSFAAISRASSARDSAADHVSGGVALSYSNNNSHNQNHNHLSREFKINDIVGDGVSGILYKWVNYGRGWRPRWFVLQDGVLSYYKIHGPDKIVVSQETEGGSRVIGEESMRRIMGQHSSHNHHSRNGSSGSPSKSRKPVGEVHLKVSFFLNYFYLMIINCDVWTM